MEILIIGTIRILGSLPVLRWAFVGAIIAILVDASDVLLMNLIDLGGLGGYHEFDKWADQAYAVTFLLVALRWRGAARNVAVGLFAYRAVGVDAFFVLSGYLITSLLLLDQQNSTSVLMLKQYT